MDNQEFNVQELVQELRGVAVESDAAKLVRAILQQTVADPDKIIDGMPEFEEDDVILFEDNTISIWHSRFMPGITVPPHDHQMSAVIGVYIGAERNDLYENDPAGGIRKSGTVEVSAGDVFSIGPSAIHGVTCASTEPCCAFHVYLGNLTEVERSLFDVNEGLTLKFTDENYARLTNAG